MKGQEMVPGKEKSQQNLDFRTDQEIKQSIREKRERGERLTPKEVEILEGDKEESDDKYTGPGWGRQR